MYLVTKVWKAPLTVASTPEKLGELLFAAYRAWRDDDWYEDAGVDADLRRLDDVNKKLRATKKLHYSNGNSYIEDGYVIIEKYDLFKDEEAYLSRCAELNIDVSKGQDTPDLSSFGISGTLTKEDV